MQSRAGEKIQAGKCFQSELEGLTSAQTPTPFRMVACDGSWKVETEDLLGPPRLSRLGTGDLGLIGRELAQHEQGPGSIPRTTQDEACPPP